MINAEKYKDKILTIAEDGYLFAINKNDKNNVIRCCSDMKCQDCMFDDEESEACGYNLPRLKWLFAEYKERVKLSRLEYEILKLAINKSCEYIARDSDGQLFVFMEKPHKGESFWKTDGYYYLLEMFSVLFQFVKWEDSTPTLIKDVLENCEVVNDAEE
mgnify:CR=1 FL=1